MAKLKPNSPAAPEALTAEQREQFLAALEADPGASHVTVLRQLGVPGSKGALHDLVDREKLKDDVRDTRKDKLFEALWTHGVTGITEAVYTPSGKHAGDVRRYSARDRALLARIVGLDPGTRVQHGNQDGQPFNVGVSFDPTKLTDEQLEELRDLLTVAQPE